MIRLITVSHLRPCHTWWVFTFHQMIRLITNLKKLKSTKVFVFTFHQMIRLITYELGIKLVVIDNLHFIK